MERRGDLVNLDQRCLLRELFKKGRTDVFFGIVHHMYLPTKGQQNDSSHIIIDRSRNIILMLIT